MKTLYMNLGFSRTVANRLWSTSSLVSGRRAASWRQPTSSGILFGEERLAPLRIGLDRGAALLPVGRAGLAVLLEELQGLDHAEDLLHVAAQQQVVDNLVADDAALVDQEQPPQCDPAGEQHVVRLGDRLVQVGDQRI